MQSNLSALKRRLNRVPAKLTVQRERAKLLVVESDRILQVSQGDRRPPGVSVWSSRRQAYEIRLRPLRGENSDDSPCESRLSRRAMPEKLMLIDHTALPSVSPTRAARNPLRSGTLTISTMGRFCSNARSSCFHSLKSSIVLPQNVNDVLVAGVGVQVNRNGAHRHSVPSFGSCDGLVS